MILNNKSNTGLVWNTNRDLTIYTKPYKFENYNKKMGD